MSGHDDLDDDLENEHVTRLRSVWSAMPDEDPPETGMAALMAAATKRAHEMAPPQASSMWAMSAMWAMWAKLLELLRRPPVLAMATVVVLVGGAVLVNRREDMSAADRAVQSAAPMQPAPTGADRGILGVPSAALESPPSPPPMPQVEPPSREPGTIAEPIVTGSSTNTLPPAKPAMPHAGKVSPKPEPRNEVRDHEKAKVEPAADPARRPGERGADRLDAKPDAKPDAKASPQKSPASPPPSEIATDAPSAPATSAALTSDQLLAQCLAAAERGDCHAARDLATRISTTNPTFYRDRVLKSAAISKCLSIP